MISYWYVLSQAQQRTSLASLAKLTIVGRFTLMCRGTQEWGPNPGICSWLSGFYAEIPAGETVESYFWTTSVRNSLFVKMTAEFHLKTGGICTDNPGKYLKSRVTGAAPRTEPNSDSGPWHIVLLGSPN
jgi:hypothetical protein